MKYSNKIYVLISALIMMAVGSFIAFAPVDYLASLSTSTANVPMNPFNNPPVNLLSDLRGMGGMLLVLSVYILSSFFRTLWLPNAILVSTLVYTAFLVFRSIGFVLDGFPNLALMLAYIIEMILAASGFWLIQRNKNIHTS